MEKVAQRILALIDDVRYTNKDVEYLAWQMVQQSPRNMLDRVYLFGLAIVRYVEEMVNDGH